MTGTAASLEANIAEPKLGLGDSPLASGRADNSSNQGTGALLQAAHQRLCAVLTIKLVRRLLELDPHALASQLARSVGLAAGQH